MFNQPPSFFKEERRAFLNTEWLKLLNHYTASELHNQGHLFFRNGRLEDAFLYFTLASKIEPLNSSYQDDKEHARQILIKRVRVQPYDAMNATYYHSALECLELALTIEWNREVQAERRVLISMAPLADVINKKFEILSTYPRKTTLNLQGCTCSTQTMDKLIIALIRPSEVSHLYLDDSYNNEKSLQRLADTLIQNYNLKFLVFDDDYDVTHSKLTAAKILTICLERNYALALSPVKQWEGIKAIALEQIKVLKLVPSPRTLKARTLFNRGIFGTALEEEKQIEERIVEESNSIVFITFSDAKY